MLGQCLVHTLSPLLAIPISASSSNASIPPVADNLSATDDDSCFVDTTQDSDSTDGSCPGLAKIQVRAIDFFSAHSNTQNIPSIPTDIRILDYADPFDSIEDDPLVANPDPSFDRDNPYSHIMTTRLPINSIAPQQYPFAPYDPDAVRLSLIHI